MAVIMNLQSANGGETASNAPGTKRPARRRHTISASSVDTLVEDQKFFVTLHELRCQPINHLWAITLGVSAFFDFSAAMARRHHRHDTDGIVDSARETVVHWLCDHSNELGILFSLLWFMDAFVGAHRKRMQAVRFRDKKKLLCGNDRDCDVRVEEYWKGCQGVYIRAIALQILLLPVGFFIFSYNRFIHLWNPHFPSDSVVTIVHHTADVVPDESEVFQSTASVSLGFAVFKHLAITIARRTDTLVRLEAIERARKVAYTLALRGLRHPFRFNRRIRYVLSIFRWIQYLGPLFGTANKLKGSVNNLLEKMKQRRVASLAARFRKSLLRSVKKNVILDFYASVIQEKFRAHQSRKKLPKIRILQGDKEMIAALKLQYAFRGSLSRARERLKRKVQVLELLKRKERESAKKKSQVKMSVTERRRMYLLQEELEIKAEQLFNEKLLLRPNTRFAVMWKFMFVVAVLFEISTLASQPFLSRHMDSSTGKQLDMEYFMDKMLIPTPVFKRPECTGEIPIQLKFWHPIRSIRQIVKLLRRKLQPAEPRPWYCKGSYSRLQSVYIYFADIAVHHFLVLVSIIMFFDVYVEFFTGKYDIDTGRLIPPPFFERFLFPGLLLQLLVNPEMDTIAHVISRFLVGIIHHDPIRILRWTVALFYPLFLALTSVVRKLWLSYVINENQRNALHRSFIFCS
jgi:hypothetical protein